MQSLQRLRTQKSGLPYHGRLVKSLLQGLEEEFQQQVEREQKLLQKTSYREFLRATTPARWDLTAPHILRIADALDALDRGEFDRLAIFMPPRHGKTETTTIRYPVKYLLENPDQNVLLTGYNERFAKRLGRKARNLAVDLIEIDQSKKASDEWVTSAGGTFMTRGVGSPPTGVGFSRIIIDDPIRKREDADSEAFREKLWDWFTDDLMTRLEPGGKVVLIMTIWHYDDISTSAIASEPGRWKVLKFPALAEENDELGRQPGEALWPARISREMLERQRDLMGTHGHLGSFEALYQQNPTPRTGGFFKIDQIQIVDSLPEELPMVRAWDKAATADAGDFTAGVKLAGPDINGFVYVMDVRRGQWDTANRDFTIRQTAIADGEEVAIWGPEDPGSAGKTDAEFFITLLGGFNVRTSRVSGSKEVRAGPFSAQVNAGKVRLIKGAWNTRYIEELRQFPKGKNDDQVDASSDAYRELITNTAQDLNFGIVDNPRYDLGGLTPLY